MKQTYPFLFTLSVLFTPLIPSTASAGACGVIDSKTVTTCKVYAETTCALKCDEASMELVCSAQCKSDSGCKAACTLKVVESCKTKCSTTQGALFCNTSQFVDCGDDLTPCVKEIEANGQTVSNWQFDATGKISASGSGCAVSASPASAEGVTFLFVLGSLFAAFAIRRLNRVR